MDATKSRIFLIGLALILSAIVVEAGVIKDLYQKITSTNNKTEGLIRESSPICGSGIFSTPNQFDLSPELIFITNSPIGNEGNFNREDNSNGQHPYGRDNSNYGRNRDDERRRNKRQNGGSSATMVNEVANEFRFNADNVTLEELERHGFNRDAPVTFLMHGFTSGYPLQAWMTAIVEAYTIDRESSSQRDGYISVSDDQSGGYENQQDYYRPTSHGDQREFHNSNHNQDGHDRYNQNNWRNQSNQNGYSTNNNGRDYSASRRRRSNRVVPVRHNLFVVNWNYAARGILYPRAVANIPIVATYVTRFINNKLLGVAQVDSRRIQLIGHSLGAHLAGFIGKNTRSKLGRIYGLDPAGPCFGAISGPLYPSSKRLAATDAEQVITIHTDTDLLGIDKALGRYAVFVEGGSKQPGCKGQGGVLKSLSTLTWDGGDFDTVACSHSRAPTLLTFRHRQSDCQMVAYECESWKAFEAGHCGVCSDRSGRGNRQSTGAHRPVECIRIGLDWQYPKRQKSERPKYPSQSNYMSSNNQHDHEGYHSSDQREDYGRNSTRRPSNQLSYTDSQYNGGQSGSQADGGSGFGGQSFRQTSRRPFQSSQDLAPSRNRRQDSQYNSGQSSEKVEPLSMFMKTSDTQPYCAYHYQIILELNEPIAKRNPSISLILQDSEGNEGSGGRQREQNSITTDQFGNKYDDRTFTHLLTSNKKLKRVDHATLLFRNTLPNGYRILKSLSINYMSNIDPRIRERFSTRLCPTQKNSQDEGRGLQKDTRFFFEPCRGD